MKQVLLPGKSTPSFILPPGTYTGIELGLVLSSDLNATIPRLSGWGTLVRNYWEAVAAIFSSSSKAMPTWSPMGNFRIS